MILANAIRAHSPSLIAAFAANFVWINLSEVFRYFVFVMPMMREALPGVPNVAPMNPVVFLIWGLWDTLLIVTLVVTAWLFLEKFGHTIGNALLAGTFFWLSVFCILWLALLNMRLATLEIALIALPLALIEMWIGALLTYWSLQRFGMRTHPR
jgi:hypothetical protein